MISCFLRLQTLLETESENRCFDSVQPQLRYAFFIFSTTAEMWSH